MQPVSPELNHKRLAAVLELIGSDKPGERQAAAEAAHRMLQAAGLRWNDVLARPVGPPPTPPPRRKTPDWRTLASTAGRRPELLSVWERDFLAGLGGFRRVSRKQYAILARLAGRVGP